MNVNVKQAVETAIKAIIESFEGVSQARLEEVMRSDDDSTWLITVSFLRKVEPDEVKTGLSSLMAINPMLTTALMRREYKTVHIDANSGEVKAIKIREIAHHGSLAS